MVWLRPLKLMTRLLELVASERSRCVEYLGALPFPGRTREGDERRVPMELAGEWVEGCPWICPPLRSVCRPVCNLVARPPPMLRSATHSRHIVHTPPLACLVRVHQYCLLCVSRPCALRAHEMVPGVTLKGRQQPSYIISPVSYTHLTLPTTGSV